MAAFKPYEVIMRIDYGEAAQDGDALQVCMKGKAVQELVRCKDCAHKEYCEWCEGNDDGFCHEAKRKEADNGRKVNS